jgi:hypothetical protein
MDNINYNFVTGKKLGYYDVKITHDIIIRYLNLLIKIGTTR